MKKKEIIVCILAIVILLVSISNVLAMDSEPIDVDDLTGNTANNRNNSTNTIIDVGNVTAEKDQPLITTKNNTLNTNIPDTGIADTPIVPIVICVISAVVAYTQIRKYNV